MSLVSVRMTCPDDTATSSSTYTSRLGVEACREYDIPSNIFVVTFAPDSPTGFPFRHRVSLTRPSCE